MPVARKLVAQQVIQVGVKMSAGNERRVKTLQRAAGGIARIGEQRLLRRLALCVKTLEHRPRHKHFAAYLKLTRPVAVLQDERNAPYRPDVGRNVVAMNAVAASNSADKPAVDIGQRNGQTVVLHLATYLKILSAQAFAYAVVKAIQWVHGYTSVRLVGTYLMGVCVLQCLLALLIDGIPEVKQVIDTYFLQGAEFMERTNRLYGIGAALDVSGIRFSCVLVIIAVILATLSETESRKYTFFYLMAFIWISIVGNMIARTTTVGVFLGMTYLIYKTRLYTLHIKVNEHIRLWMYFGILLMIAVFVSAYLYQVDLKFRHDFRFAFEGFFSLAEEGKWNVSSNNTLKFMYVFPDNIKTWIIGDGYLSNPADVDPYFTGKIIKGFYMGTDVGYLRFIFYFGLIGLIVFTGLFHKASQICQNRFPNQKDMFILLLIVNYIVWFKVSTDVFSTFAILLMIDKEKTQKTNNEYES